MALFNSRELAAQAAALLLGLATAITPPADEQISAWANGRVNIPGETGTTREGPLSWDGFEPLIEPLDRLHPDDPARTVTFVGSAQIAKTTIGVIATLYYSTAISRPWCVALPSADEALKYNRTKWQPLVDATPELRRHIEHTSPHGQHHAGQHLSCNCHANSPRLSQQPPPLILTAAHARHQARPTNGRFYPARRQTRRRLLAGIATSSASCRPTPAASASTASASRMPEAGSRAFSHASN